MKLHNQDKNPIAEIQSEKVEINTVQDALDLMADSGYLGARKVVIRQENLCPEFFDLSTGIAGEILQKFSNYSMQLAIVGDFSVFGSRSLRDFICESNRTGQIFFVPSVQEAIKIFSERK